MNRIIKTVFALFLVAAFQSCGPTPDDAIKYNDGIIDNVNSVVYADNDLTEALQKDPEDMDAAQKKLVSTITASIDNIKKMDKFDGKTEFADEAVKYLSVYKAVAETEYKEMVAINSKPADELTDEDDTKYNELNEQSEKKLKAASSMFNVFQESFSIKYKYKIEDKAPVVE